MKSDLADLIETLIDCPRPGRIDLREPILAHGVSAVGPLREAAGRNPDLGPSVCAWLVESVGACVRTSAEAINTGHSSGGFAIVTCSATVP